jgi:O-antigen/teichoic acid export membrane protein
MNQHSRRKDTSWSVFFGYTNVGISLIRNILMVPLYLKFIELEEYGAWLATGSVLINLVMTDFGLAGATTQRVSYLLGKQHFDGLGQAIGTSYVSGLILSGALSILAFSVSSYIPLMMDLGGTTADRVLACFLLAILANAISIPGMMSVSILRSMHYPIASGLLYAGADLISLLSTAFLLFNDYGLYSIAIGLLIRSMLLLLTGTIYCVYICKKDYQLQPKVSTGEARVLFVNSGYLFLSALAMKIQTQSDVFFVGLFSGPGSAGIYGLSIRAFETVLLLVSQINRGLAPSLANLHGTDQVERFKQVVAKFSVIILFCSTVSLGCFALLNHAFVALWVGEHAYAGDKMTYLMAMAGYSFLFSTVAYDILGARAEYKLMSKIFLPTALLHVLIILLVSKNIGIWCVPSAMLVTSTIWGALFWYFATEKIGSSSRERLLVVDDMLLLAAATAVTVWGMRPFNFQIDAWSEFVLQALAAIAVLSLVNLVVCRGARDAVLGEIKNVF